MKAPKKHPGILLIEGAVKVPGGLAIFNDGQSDWLCVLDGGVFKKVFRYEPDGPPKEKPKAAAAPQAAPFTKLVGGQEACGVCHLHAAAIKELGCVKGNPPGCALIGMTKED